MKPGSPPLWLMSQPLDPPGDSKGFLHGAQEARKKVSHLHTQPGRAVRGVCCADLSMYCPVSSMYCCADLSMYCRQERGSGTGQTSLVQHSYSQPVLPQMLPGQQQAQGLQERAQILDTSYVVPLTAGSRTATQGSLLAPQPACMASGRHPKARSHGQGRCCACVASCSYLQSMARCGSPRAGPPCCARACRLLWCPAVPASSRSFTWRPAQRPMLAFACAH